MTITNLADTVTLHNGVELPRFGLGVFLAQAGSEVEQAVSWALEAGYRSIDTAYIYRNEADVGRAIRRSKIPRQEIFVTTKVWNNSQGYDKTLQAFDDSLNRLEMDAIDLYLVHWPVVGQVPDAPLYNETWQAMEAIYKSGRARAIGVSNFLVHHLQTLLPTAKITPMVNQVEFHPYLQQPDLQAFCRDHHIQLEAWSPIMQGRVFDVPELVDLGKKYSKNAVQVTLRWMLQKGIVTIPKSVKKERITDNADVFDFELDAADIALIDNLDRGQRLGADPDNFDF
jgi:diketogulonate reductase-like aldo/keto reductase